MRADLTDDFIAGLMGTGKLYRVFDLTLRALCIAVAPGGSKRWYIRNGEAWQTLGKWPEVDSRAARAGSHGERNAFWDRLEAHCERVKPSTARTYRLIIVHWQNALAGLRLDQITPTMIMDRLPAGSNRWRNQCLAVLSLGFNLAEIGIMLGHRPGSAMTVRYARLAGSKKIGSRLGAAIGKVLG